MRDNTHDRSLGNTLLRQYIHESVYESNALLIEQILLQEGLAGDLKDIFRDIVKVAAGAGAVIGTAGLGGDTITDMIFAVEGSAEVLMEVESVASSAGELGDAIAAAKQTNISAGPAALYDAVLSATESVAAAGGEEALDKAKESIDELLEKLANSIGEWVATALPDDAGLGGIAIREAIEAVIGVVSNDVYDLLKGAFNGLPAEVQKFIADPAAMEAFLNEITDDLVEFLDDTQTSSSEGEEEGGITAFVADAAKTAVKLTPNGMMMSAAASIAIPKIIEYLNGDFRALIPEASKILNTLVTVAFGVVALLQILEREEYKEAEVEADKEAEESDVVKDATKAANENMQNLRQIIRNELSQMPV